MMELLFQSIIEMVQSLGFLGVFYGALLEEFFYVVPSSLVQLSAGAILLGELSMSWDLVVKSILWIGIPAAVGVTLGSLPYYALGYFGGKPAVLRWGKWLGVSWQQVEDIQKKFTKTWLDELIFTGLRALPILPSVALSVGPGVLRMPMRTYLLGSFFGTFIRATIMGFVGSRLGAGAASISKTIENAQVVGLVFFVITGLIVFYYWRKKRKGGGEKINKK